MPFYRYSALFLLWFLLALPAVAQSDVTIENAFPELSFSRPVDLQNAGDDTNRLFVVEQHTGMIHVFENDPATTQTDLFLDIDGINTGGEEGLLGLAFHPDYENNGYFFVYYSTSSPRRSVISRFSVDSANPNQADPSSELIILEIGQPFSNHNGGQLAFGPQDGYLYIGLGDGGDGGDPQDHGEDPKTLLGSILRIDVNNSSEAERYAIPADNPFVGNTDSWREEIYAYGLRNPWRFSFDSETGDLWAADVGQGRREEIDRIVKGGNYGWDIMEGTLCFEPSNDCDTTSLEMPIWEYGRSLGQSVTGGYVYRGTRVPELAGKYIYADYVSRRIWALTDDGVNPVSVEELPQSPGNVAAFGVAEDNALFVCAFDGSIYRFNSSGSVTNEDPSLSEGHAILSKNYPNPFHSITTLPFSLNRPAQVDLAIFDVLGRRVRTLAKGVFPEGRHAVEWEGSSDSGQSLPGGIYFYRLIENGITVETRMITMVR